jgi:hypothetical protein
MYVTGTLKGRPSWRVMVDMPRTLVVALHLRDAAGLQVRGAHTVPSLEPFVDLDGALVSYAGEAAAEAWALWWDGLLDRHPEFSGVPPLVPDPFPELAVDLRALIGIGLPAADAWFEARKHEDMQERLRRQRRNEGRTHSPITPVAQLVNELEEELGRPVAPFDLLISILPVRGVWGRRVRRDHVLISKSLIEYVDGAAALLEPVVRELAA